MANPATTQRDLEPRQQPGRWEREAETLHKSGLEDSVTKSCRIYFFVILGVIVATFVVFLLLRPQ